MKQILVFGEKTFKIEIPDDAKMTFGPWSPPPRKNSGYSDHTYNPQGTLRIYQGTKENIIGVFCNVTGFRDLSLQYAEQVAKEEGATIWKSDQDGYTREDKVSSKKEWVNPATPALITSTAKKKARSA